MLFNQCGPLCFSGLVPSPTLNMLPTAEDVEAMIQSMRSEDMTAEDTPSSQSCPPSAPPTSCITTTSQSSQPTYTNSSGREHTGSAFFKWAAKDENFKCFLMCLFQS